jgi:hypothetical protein
MNSNHSRTLVLLEGCHIPSSIFIDLATLSRYSSSIEVFLPLNLLTIYHLEGHLILVTKDHDFFCDQTCYGSENLYFNRSSNQISSFLQNKTSLIQPIHASTIYIQHLSWIQMIQWIQQLSHRATKSRIEIQNSIKFINPHKIIFNQNQNIRSGSKYKKE